MTANEFSVGNRVDVIDRRDGATVDTNVTITSIIMEHGRPYAVLSCGYACGFACLRNHQPTIADALPRSLRHAINIAKESGSPADQSKPSAS